ncbi:MAG: hypothetical protein Kow0069_03360 [Promethearchaeota archaeon]
MGEAPANAFARAAAGAGFDVVEFRVERVEEYLAAGGSTSELREEVETGNKTRVASLNALEDFSLAGSAKFKREVLPAAERMAELTYKLEGDLVVAVPSFLPGSGEGRGVEWGAVVEKTRQRLVELSKVCSKYDVNVGFEFLGFPTCSVRTIEQAAEVLAPLYHDKRENLGLVVDTFHYAVGGSESALNRRDESLLLVHVNDLPESFSGRLEEARDEDRVLPGEGFLDLEGILSGVAGRVPLSVELFDEELAKRPPGEVATECFRALDGLRRRLDHVE